MEAYLQDYFTKFTQNLLVCAKTLLNRGNPKLYNIQHARELIALERQDAHVGLLICTCIIHVRQIAQFQPARFFVCSYNNNSNKKKKGQTNEDRDKKSLACFCDNE